MAARAGLAARGVVYGIVAALAASVALRGDAEQEADTVGALAALAARPYGEALLWALAVGLTGYAAWRAAQAVTGRTSTREDAGPWVRLGSAARAAVYLTLALAAVRSTTQATGSAAETQESWTAMAFDWPGGRALVAAAGAVAVVVGLVEIWKGLSGRFLRRLQEGRLGDVSHGVVRLVGTFGHAGRGLSYVLVGAFVIRAAEEHDPSKSRGLDGALAELVREDYGPPLLLLLAAGLLAFAVYSLAEARWRRIRA